ncbi:ribonucleoside-triphosphate reductase, adenosylcobalamin-dependent [Kitasatospora sp. MBT66]|uniref:ribonucleoside-triphosphate reductase, adenosylcobalamin-dependent n=1 Tax=Kitasatospora sp. MBT66 TaxID=1444769 RepID=UPI0005BE50E1|nr:ribonucleoside-triphosphate reductase, adenosylcobalamin-dependent [Kitasatospora sp. MBT66]
MTFKTETAQTVYERTYRREKADGTLETWPETVRRVVDGNLKLVNSRYIEPGEREALTNLIEDFRALPAGRHLKSSGVADYALNNCWAAGWDAEKPEEHFTFALLRLAEGGGVGSNYSNRYLSDFPAVRSTVRVHVVCDPEHPDYLDMIEAGLISGEYSHTWAGAYPVEDSREGWAKALGGLIRAAHRDDLASLNRVFDVSRVRHKGAALRKFGGTASGPAPFAELLIKAGDVLAGAAGGPLTGMDAMAIDHEIARCIVSGGVRRSARMSIMHWADPQIGEFLACKADQGQHWTTNISVEVDGEFITQARAGGEKAALVLAELATGATKNGEPGFWNSELTAGGEVDGVFTTNPCGEATLTEWEPCNLGSVNLGAYVDRMGHVDFKGLHQAHRLLTRYLIRATCAPVADPRSAEAIKRYRRIGVGHLGFADYLAKQGVLYSDAPDFWLIAANLREFAAVVDQAAAEYANELRIPVPIKKRVVAPTGTISKLAGASGEGIHAPFADFFIRRIRFSTVEPEEVAKVEDYRRRGYQVEPCIYAANTMVVSIPTKDPLVDEVLDPEYVQHAGQLGLEDMLRVQELYQTYWADQAVSYTASVDPKRYGLDDIQAVLLHFMPTLKGSTIFPEMSRAQAPYERISREEYEAEAARLGIEVTDTSYDEICTSGACPV